MSDDPRLSQGSADIILGQIALERGWITPGQLKEALSEQAREVAGGRAQARPLGNILVSRGFLTEKDLADLLEEQRVVAANTLRDRPAVRPSAAPPPKPVAPSNRMGKYAIVRELGRGGMGIVYEAVDTQLGRKVALKTMLTSPNANPKETRLDEERFLREAKLSAGLAKHPCIVSVYEAGVIEGQRYLAMEYIEGQSLTKWRKQGSVTIRHQVSVLRDVALAVHHAHTHGIIHRDLKPENILMDRQNIPHVTDFGLAKTLGQNVSVSLTASGMIVGTPAYMSPEQAQGLKSIDHRTDIWSLGVMLYEILTGRTPFQGETAIEILMKAVKNSVPPPSSVVKGGAAAAVDPAIENICLKALAKTSRDRYLTAEAFANDLSRWMQGEQVIVVPPSTRRREVKSARSSSGWIFGFVAALVLAGIGGLIAWPYLRPPQVAVPPVHPPPPPSDPPKEPKPPPDPIPDPPSDDWWRGAVDLLALVDVKRHAVSGIWKREGDRIVSDAGTPSRVEIPYIPPEEYDLRIVFSRISGQDEVNVVLARGERQFSWVMGEEKDSGFGFRIRIKADDAVSRGGWRWMRGTGLGVGITHTAVLQVRKDVVRAYLDGNPFAQWKSDGSDLSLGSDWSLRRGDVLGLGTRGSPTSFQGIALRCVKGKGIVIDKPPEWIDLLAVPDIEREAVEGEWKREEAGLISGGRGRNRFQLPWRAPEEYDLRVAFTRLSGDRDINLLLSGAGRRFMWAIDNQGASYVPMAAGKANPITKKPTRRIPTGKRHEALVEVRKDGFRASLDGNLMGELKTNYLDVFVHQDWWLRDPRCMGFGTADSSVAFEKVEVRPLTGQPLLMRVDAALPAEKEWEKAVDLVRYVDPRRDAVRGTWLWHEGKLLTVSGEWSHLEIPYRPPREYDVRVQFTRIFGYDTVALILGKEGRQFEWGMGWAANRGYALAGINITAGETRNPTYREPWNVLQNGKAHTTIVQVRKDGAKAYLDGKLLVEWRTDHSDWSLDDHWRLRDQNIVGLGAQLSTTLFHRIELLPVTGEGSAVREGSSERIDSTAPLKAVAVDLSKLKPGLVGEYYLGRWFNSLSLRKIDAALDFDWKHGSAWEGGPSDCFSAKWTGYVAVPKTDRYIFGLARNDGAKLWVDGALLIDRWGDSDDYQDSGSCVLEKGLHRLRVEFFDHWNAASLRLSWLQGPQRQEAVVGPGALFHDSAEFKPYVASDTPEAKSPAQVRAWKAHYEGCSAIVSGDGKTIASSMWEPPVRLWEMQTGRKVHEFGDSGQVHRFAFSPDGKTLVAAGQDALIRVWDVVRGVELQRLRGHSDQVRAVAFSADGKILASGQYTNGQIRFWDTATWKEQPPTITNKQVTNALAFSPDGRLLASGCYRHHIVLWESSTGKEFRYLDREQGEMHINSVAFSPDGKILASAGVGGIINLWDVAAGSRLDGLQANDGTVYSVTFTPDGQSLVSGADDGIVRIWDVKKRKQSAQLEGHTGAVNSVSLAKDGRTLVTAGNDLTIRVWDITKVK